jgi:hypothetical protein
MGCRAALAEPEATLAEQQTMLFKTPVKHLYKAAFFQYNYKNHAQLLGGGKVTGLI